MERAAKPVISFAVFWLFVSVAVLPACAAGVDPCLGRRTSILVEHDRRMLLLCQDGRESGSFKVSFGKGGMDKQRQGDNRTPVGEYTLGAPRPSERFGIFIPVGYPTPGQRKAGYTGGDIGIHGPDRRFAWLGGLATWFDWTQGCIAVGTDGEMSRIADWVKKRKVVTVIIK